MNGKGLRLAACALAFGMVVSTAPSYGYRLIQNFSTGRVTAGSAVACGNSFAHWNNAVTNWYLNAANQGASKDAAIYNAMNVWTFVPNASHTPTYRGRTNAGFSTDGLNVVSWGTGQGCGTGCLALTALVLQSGQVIVESDITFNNSYTWSTNGTNQDTWSVAAHEFGHALGIHHTELGPGPTMYFSYTSGTTTPRSLEADDHGALQCSQSTYPPAVSCIPDGGVDDVLSNTHCCSGVDVTGSTYCTNPADYGASWASCYQICGTVPTGSCAPAGGVDDTLYNTSCCSGSMVPFSTRCLDPADYNTDWASCIHTCA